MENNEEEEEEGGGWGGEEEEEKRKIRKNVSKRGDEKDKEGEKDENKEVKRRGRMSSSRLLISTRLPSPAKQVIIIRRPLGPRRCEILASTFARRLQG